MDGDAGRDGGDGQMDAGARDDAGGGDDDAGGGGGMDAGGGDDDAGGGGDDAGGGGGDDAGMMTGDAGTVGDCRPGPITIQETCPALTPCDASLVGAWCYTGVCIEEGDLFGALPGGCTAEVQDDFTGTIVGRVEFTDTTAMRQVRTSVSGTVHVSGGLCSLPGACATVESQFNDAVGPDGSAMCAAATGGGCDCNVTLTTTVDETNTYVTDGAGELAVGTGSSRRTYDYCVESGTLRVQETTPGREGEPGIQSLAPAP